MAAQRHGPMIEGQRSFSLPDPPMLHPRPQQGLAGRARQLHDYWQSKRGGRSMPARDDIDPAEIKGLLPYVIISDLFADPLRVRYRLAGTVVTDSFGFNIAGCWLHELNVTGSLKEWIGVYERVMASKRPVHGMTDATRDSILMFRCCWVILPLSSDGVIVDKCIELEDWNRVSSPARFNDDSLVWSLMPDPGDPAR